VTDNASWLSVAPTSGSTPATLTLTADPAGLAAGTYTGTVTATATGFAPASMQVTFSVQSASGSTLQVSLSPDRSAPVALHGAQVSGSIYVFFPTEPGITRVRFWIDNPARTGSPFKTENNAPYDLAGTASSTGAALPFNASSLGAGTHTVTAHIERSGGTSTITTSTFTVI
jgi:hypothetical protein